MLIDITRPLEPATAVFPGDVPFSRPITMSMRDGASCNVTCFHGSAHAGTHADMPHHFADGAAEYPLESYIGPATVVLADEWSALPNPSNVHPRVLFRTRNSRSDFTRFDPGFSFPPASAIDWLIEARAVLVGVDGPSVDAVDSKDLENHHRLHQAAIAILENLDLSKAVPGDCELIALPLRIPGADGTWVRAVLRQRDRDLH